jgi:hypothetical protein
VGVPEHPEARTSRGERVHEIDGEGITQVGIGSSAEGAHDARRVVVPVDQTLREAGLLEEEPEQVAALREPERPSVMVAEKISDRIRGLDPLPPSPAGYYRAGGR